MSYEAEREIKKANEKIHAVIQQMELLENRVRLLESLLAELGKIVGSAK